MSLLSGVSCRALNHCTCDLPKKVLSAREGGVKWYAGMYGERGRGQKRPNLCGRLLWPLCQ